jgi:hypothetical protein
MRWLGVVLWMRRRPESLMGSDGAHEWGLRACPNFLAGKSMSALSVLQECQMSEQRAGALGRGNILIGYEEGHRCAGRISFEIVLDGHASDFGHTTVFGRDSYFAQIGV